MQYTNGGEMKSDWIGRKYGDYEVIDNISKTKVLCRCSCGKVREVYKSTLSRGLSKGCGHSQIKSIIGEHFGELEVIKKLEKDKYLCKCSCGNYTEVYRSNLRNGTKTSCGCIKANNKWSSRNISVGDTFGEWTVLEKAYNGKVLCRCSCGAEKYVAGASLVSGVSKSCGHNTTGRKYELRIGETFGEWTVLKETRSSDGRVAYLCRCSCGTERIITARQLVYGTSTSCGCVSTNFYDLTGKTFGLLHVDKYAGNQEWECTCSCGNKIIAVGERLRKGEIVRCSKCKNKFESLLETELHKYIESIYNGDIIYKDRVTISPYELDIYIPEKKLAIEFNGDYWHSVEAGKSMNYHRNKTVMCAKQNIGLIHIFEHEWNSLINQEEIKKHIARRLGINYNDNIEIKSNNSTIELKNNNKCVISVDINNKRVYLKSIDYSKDIIKVLMDYIINNTDINELYLTDTLDKNDINTFLELGFKCDKLLDPKPIYYNNNSKSIVSKDDYWNTQLYDCGEIEYVWNK
jgi:hypothetical protein